MNKRMWHVEKHAMQVYTGKVYELFGQEMDKSHNYNVFPNNDCTVFTVRHTIVENIERYARPQFEVKIINHGEKYLCECGLYEHFCMLCCHILRVDITTH